MAEVQFNSVTRQFKNGTYGVINLTLRVPSGELLAVVGPSGCGKTTLLRLVAGLDAPTQGTVQIAGRDMARVPPQERDVAMAFQTPAIYPQLTVRENLAFALRVRRAPVAEIDRRMKAVAAVLDLTDLLDRQPHELSGGQRQRVALGRALVRQPAVLLLDEPLSHLDVPLRAAVRQGILELRRGLTTLWVTHDPDEARAVGDRVAEMAAGKLIGFRGAGSTSGAG